MVEAVLRSLPSDVESTMGASATRAKDDMRIGTVHVSYRHQSQVLLVFTR
jgi:hypothetical protein